MTEDEEEQVDFRYNEMYEPRKWQVPRAKFFAKFRAARRFARKLAISQRVTVLVTVGEFAGYWVADKKFGDLEIPNWFSSNGYGADNSEEEYFDDCEVESGPIQTLDWGDTFDDFDGADWADFMS